MNQPASPSAPPSGPSPRQKRVDSFLRAADVGTGSLVLLACLNLFHEAMMGTGDDILLGSIWMLGAIVFLLAQMYSFSWAFLRRNADEFTRAMWSSGTTVAFFAMMAWMIFGGIFEIIYGGVQAYEIASAMPEDSSSEALNRAVEENVSETDYVDSFVLSIGFVAFFLGLQFKRFRG